MVKCVTIFFKALFQDLEGVEIYIYDILIMEINGKTHAASLKAVPERAKSENIKN